LSENRTIGLAPDGWSVEILDQSVLPRETRRLALTSLAEAASAIRDMKVRGAPLIGVACAYGLALALRADATDAGLERARAILLATRPTAVNLRWAIDDVTGVVARLRPEDRAAAAYARANAMAEEDISICRRIGENGLPVFSALAAKKQGALQVMTHCNAGWLAAIEHGTALAPVYAAHAAGLPVHVWVAETRPRNQGHLTAWELGRVGVPHTLVTDSAAGHLFMRGEVDVVIVGTDRTTRGGDVVNKVGTYLKALAAKAHGVPFYVAAPGPSIDWTMLRGADVPIEERDASEVAAPTGTRVSNPAFDVTPAHLVTGLITERGVAPASETGLQAMYPERVTR
jgi:methylthioribose-1-phosphate isomerase